MAGDRMLELKFFESILFAEDRTGTTVRGYEPALLRVGGEIKAGRVIDAKRMDEATACPHRPSHCHAALGRW